MTPRSDRQGRSARKGRVLAARPRRARAFRSITAFFALALTQFAPACQNGEVDANQVCQFQCDYQQGDAAALTVADVVQIIANALFEAKSNGITDLTVVVNDHLNNVLAVYDSDASTVNYSRITSVEDPGSEAFAAPHATTGTNLDFLSTTTSRALNTALDGVFIPAGYAAISKAGTANYFSTQGNAFSSRTASTLIQQNFFPGETDRPGGPLFAVQIAQLVCSDVNTRQGVTPGTNTTAAGVVTAAPPDPTDLLGPRRLPVGFAADPGGLPLYKDGVNELDAALVPTGRTGKVVVGAVGIEYNGIYSLDKDATNSDRNIEERIAAGAVRGFEADPERVASRITVAGRALRYLDDGGVRSNSAARPLVTTPDLIDDASIVAFLDAISGQSGDFVNDRFFFPFDIPRRGVNFLDNASGVIAAPGPGRTLSVAAAPRGTTAEAEIVVLSDGTNRFPAIAATNPAPVGGDAANDGLSALEVQELLVNALLLAEDTRAQTRRPLGGQARIDVAVVDLDGIVLGFARSRDALLDGIDVTIAKTRQAAFWSKNDARTQLENAFDPLGRNGNLLNTIEFDDYVDFSADFLGLTRPTAPTDPPFNGVDNGGFAWSSIALGGIANPDFPPGVASGVNGPLSRNPELSEWSIFSTGIQTEIVLPAIALGLCEEVPDLAAVLSDLRDAEAALAGVAAPVGGRPALFNLNPAVRNIFCGDIRTALLGSADPAVQPDCMAGVQDNPLGSITGLQNGVHIFQGAVPIYRRNADGTTRLIGGYGVSGDGAEQDDFVPFVSLDEVFRGQLARGIANPIGNAPPAVRADNISVSNVNLRYVVCPTAPFLSSNEQNGCEGR